MQVVLKFDLARILKVACFGLIVSFALAAGTPAKAGFLEDLFGGGDEAHSAPAAAPRAKLRAAPRVQRSGFSIRINDGRKVAQRSRPKSVAFRDAGQGAGETKFPKPVFCYRGGAQPTGGPASADTRLHDGTLRSGDSVVTQNGILVFKGHAACPHNASDFVALAAAGLPKSQRNALAALERTLHDAKAPRQEEEEEPKVVGQANQ